MQLIENTIQIHHFFALGAGPGEFFLKNHRHSPVSLLPAFRPGMIYEHTAHQPRRKTIKMFSILEAQAALTDELQEKLVDHARWLEHVFRTLSPEQCTCDLPEMWVDKLKQMIGRVCLAIAPFA